MVSGVLGELLLLRVISTGTKIKNIYIVHSELVFLTLLALMEAL